MCYSFNRLMIVMCHQLDSYIHYFIHPQFYVCAKSEMNLLYAFWIYFERWILDIFILSLLCSCFYTRSLFETFLSLQD